MKVEKFVTGIISTNCYLVINEETKQTVVIATGACPKHLMGHIKSEGLDIRAILLTHGHFDHIMGIDDFLKEFDVPVYVHEGDRETITDASLNQSSVYTAGYTFSKAVYTKDGQVLSFAGEQSLDVKVLPLALPDDYVEHGSVDQLRKETGIDEETMVKKIMKAYKEL